MNIDLVIWILTNLPSRTAGMDAAKLFQRNFSINSRLWYFKTNIIFKRRTSRWKARNALLRHLWVKIGDSLLVCRLYHTIAGSLCGKAKTIVFLFCLISYKVNSVFAHTLVHLVYYSISCVVRWSPLNLDTVVDTTMSMYSVDFPLIREIHAMI